MSHQVRPSESSTAAYLQQADSADRTDRMYSMKGKATPHILEGDQFRDLLRVWRSQNAEYDALVTRFQQQQRESRRNNRAHLVVRDIADWRDTRPALTQTEQNWIAMQPDVKVVPFSY